MDTFSALLCAENSSVTGECPSQRPVTRSFDVFFDLHLNKRPRKQSWGCWLETPSRSLWRHCNRWIYWWTLSIPCKCATQRLSLTVVSDRYNLYISTRQKLWLDLISYGSVLPLAVVLCRSICVREFYKRNGCTFTASIHIHSQSHLYFWVTVANIIISLQSMSTFITVTDTTGGHFSLIFPYYPPPHHLLQWPLLLTWFNFNPSMDK